MTRNKVYLCIQAVLCILLVVLLSAQAIGIYTEGVERRTNGYPMEWIYTREKAAERFAPIAPLFFAAIGVMVAGLILGVKDENQDQPVKDAELARDLVRSRVAVPSEPMIKEQALQKKLKFGGWAAFALCCIPIVLYLTNPSHFESQDLEFVVGHMVSFVVPWVAIGLGILMICTKLEEKSILRETDAATARMKEEKAGGVTKEPQTPLKEPNLTAVRAVLLIAAIAFIIAGIFNGSMRDVLYKAIKICTECVGLG